MVIFCKGFLFNKRLAIVSSNKWKRGTKIQFYANAFTKRFKQIDHGICTDVQHITIFEGHLESPEKHEHYHVFVDGASLSRANKYKFYRHLSMSVHSFNSYAKRLIQLSYLNRSTGYYEGRLIHWSEDTEYLL